MIVHIYMRSGLLRHGGKSSLKKTFPVSITFTNKICLFQPTIKVCVIKNQKINSQPVTRQILWCSKNSVLTTLITTVRGPFMFSKIKTKFSSKHLRPSSVVPDKVTVRRLMTQQIGFLNFSRGGL